MGRPRVSRLWHAVPAAVHRRLDQCVAAGICRDFYLAGGTGLALLLNHRRSVDLDFFSRRNRLDAQGRRALLARLRHLPGWEALEGTDGTLHGRVGRVRISFFWYPEPLVKPLIRRNALRIASLDDIALMKIGAVIGRGSRKDFMDLYAIAQQLPLARVLAQGSKKFSETRDFTLQALKALSFFDDAERDPPVLAPQPPAWDAVKAFFRNEVRRLCARYL